MSFISPSENILLSGDTESVRRSVVWLFETHWTTVLRRGARPLCPEDPPGRSSGRGGWNLNSFTWYTEDSSVQLPSVFTDSLLSLLEPWFLPGFRQRGVIYIYYLQNSSVKKMCNFPPLPPLVIQLSVSTTIDFCKFMFWIISQYYFDVKFAMWS